MVKPPPFRGIDRSVAPDLIVDWRSGDLAPTALDFSRLAPLPPPFHLALVPASFYFAWCRRWAAHRLSTALGYPSKEPVI